MSNSPFSGRSVASQYLDVFVSAHAVIATAFATAMLATPGIFSLLVTEPADFNDLATDSVRWACPFVFGFGGLAALSLYTVPETRRMIAGLFAGSFLLETCLGVWMQTGGRWNGYCLINIALFGCLCLTYGVFLVCFPHAFTRGEREHYVAI